MTARLSLGDVEVAVEETQTHVRVTLKRGEPQGQYFATREDWDKLVAERDNLRSANVQLAANHNKLREQLDNASRDYCELRDGIARLLGCGGLTHEHARLLVQGAYVPGVGALFGQFSKPRKRGGRKS